MLIFVIFIALMSQFALAFGSKHACVPNSQFVLNEKICFCDSLGWWNTTSCRDVDLRSCTPGQIIWQGCSQCICQETGQLICNNEACYEAVTNKNGYQDTIHTEVLKDPNSVNWCTPYKSYYVNCSICVCSASGKTADSHCAIDYSCQKQPPSTSDFLSSVNKNICIPKVTYLFSCLQCLCSDGGYFTLDECVETCHRPQQQQQAQAVRRCIPRTFYKRNCNICWCPDDSVVNDKYCTKTECNRKTHKFRSLQSIQSISMICQVNTFHKPQCFYCSCNSNGNVNEQFCFESDCLKNYFKYDVVKKTCSPGEMVPICQECFCLKGGITNQTYCSKLCTYQSKLNVLEKVLKDDRGEIKLFDREKIVKKYDDSNCQPNSMYIDHSRYCLCPDNGNTNFKLCTSNLEDLKKPTRAFAPLPSNNSLTSACDPNTFVEIDCNTCYCGKNGRIDPKWCTNDDCDAKRMIQYGQNTLRFLNTHNKVRSSDTCIPGSMTKVGCNFCICSQTGLMKDRACTKNVCTGVQNIYDEKLLCEPLAYYLVDCNVCLCPRDGVKNVEKCTKKICEKPILRSDSCTPGEFFSNECNICVCPPNGKKADRTCTRHKCSDSEIPWKKIFMLSQILLDNRPVMEMKTSAPKQDLDFCYSGEEFEFGCQICMCPDVGLKSHATCSDIMCDEKNNHDSNRLDGTDKDSQKDDEDQTALVRSKRCDHDEPDPAISDIHQNTNIDCYTFNVSDSSERKECTPGSMYIIRCRQCICPYMGNINLFCRSMPKGKYCEQAFPNFNYVPMGRRAKSNEDDSQNKTESTEIVSSSDVGTNHIRRHNHTKFKCANPGKVLDECFICECEGDTLIEEHCFHSNADKCKDAKPTYLDYVNKVVLEV